MFDKVNVSKIIGVLKETVDFAKTTLSYDYSPPNEENNSYIDLKPDECSISLLANITENVIIIDGGFVDSTSELITSLKIEMWIKKNVIAKSNFSISGVSISSSKSLFRGLKKMLLDNYPTLVKKYIGGERKNNGLLNCAPRDSVNYIEEVPENVKISDEFIDILTELSESVYKYSGVISNSVTFTHNLKSNFFVNEGSEIAQFKSSFQITILFEYINHDNLHVEDVLVEHFNVMPTIEDVLALEEKCTQIIKDYTEFHSLTSGTYPVLLKPSASDVFFHEALAAHLLSATFVTGELGIKSTIFKDGIGRKIPSLEGVDIIMDPGLKDGFGSYKYDHEGSLAEKVYLVKNGEVLNYLTDRRSAAYLEQDEKDEALIKQLVEIVKLKPSLLTEYVNEKHLIRNFKDYSSQLKHFLGKCILDDLINNCDVDSSLNWRSDSSLLVKKSNGHCRVQAWVGVDDEGYLINVPSEARMSNLIVEVNNTNTLKDLELQMTEFCNESELDFYLEVGAKEGHVEVETGLFVIMPNQLVKVYLDGRREPVNPGTFSLNLEDFLSHIYSIGSESEENKGFCGSASGFVPVGSKTPSILLLDIPYQEASDIEIAPDEKILFLQHK